MYFQLIIFQQGIKLIIKSKLQPNKLKSKNVYKHLITITLQSQAALLLSSNSFVQFAFFLCLPAFLTCVDIIKSLTSNTAEKLTLKYYNEVLLHFGGV